MINRPQESSRLEVNEQQVIVTPVNDMSSTVIPILNLGRLLRRRMLEFSRCERWLP